MVSLCYKIIIKKILLNRWQDPIFKTEPQLRASWINHDSNEYLWTRCPLCSWKKIYNGTGPITASYTSTCVMDIELPCQDTKKQILETVSKSLVHPPSDIIKMQVSAPTTSSTSPKFLSQTDILIDQLS